MGIGKAGADRIVGRDHRQRTGAAGPPIRMEGFFGLPGVIRIIEGMTIRLDRNRAKDGVIEHAFHAVAVARVARDAQQMACELEMRVGPAGSLKTLRLPLQTGAERAAAGNDKMLIRSPATRGETLCRDHLEALLRRRQVDRIAERQVSLCRRTQGIDMAVGMLSRQRILAAGKRREELVVEKPTSELQMNPFTGQLPRQELIFRQGVTLIPGVPAEILAGLRMLVARHGARRQVRYGGPGGSG